MTRITAILLVFLLNALSSFSQKNVLKSSNPHPVDLQNCRSDFSKVQLNDASSETVLKYLAEYPHISFSPVTLKLMSAVESPGGIHYTFLQYINNVPVYRGQIKVNITRTGTLLSVFDNSYILSQQEIIPAHDQNNFQPLVPDGNVTVKTEKIFFISQNKPFPAWRIETFNSKTNSSVETIVDLNLDTLYLRDLNTYFRSPHTQDSTVTAKVFLPDPLTTAGKVYGPPYSDANDGEVAELNAERKSVTMTADFSNDTFRLSSPYVVMKDLNGPPNIPPKSKTPDFDFTRGQDAFEDVNAYYHIQSYQYYIQSLGFLNLVNYPIEVDGQGDYADNSMFVSASSPPRLLFGVGGVDDAEDSDVIIHEYGHAISQSAAPNTNSGTERQAIDEANSDYFAVSYSRNINPFNWERVFSWDGYNEFWEGRKTVSSKHYPENIVYNIYEDAEIWSSTLMQIWEEIGRTKTDKILMQSMYSYASGMTMCDAAKLYIEADSILYGGVNFAILYKHFLARGFCLEPQQDTCYFGKTTASFSINAGNDTAVCSSLPFQLGAKPAVINSTSYQVYWSPSEGLSCTTCPNPFANPAATTQYRMMVFDSTGCIRFDEVTITVKPFSNVVIDAGKDTAVCKNSYVKLGGDPAVSGMSSSYSITWSPGAGLNCFDCENPVVLPATTTTYTASITDNAGCTKSDSITITLTPCNTISVSNTINFFENGEPVIIRFPEGTGSAAIKMHNVFGQLVLDTVHSSGENYSLFGFYFAPGVYLLSIDTGNISQTFKIVRY